MILKSRITRFIAFLTSCVLIGICAYNCSVEMADREKFMREHTISVNDTVYYQCSELYRQLWQVTMMYLRNLDEDGNFKGTPELEKHTREYLRSKGLMDKNGEITLKVPENYKYLAEWNGNSISNTDMNIDDFTSHSYWMRRNDELRYNCTINHYGYMNTGEANWFETNYGMTYYYVFGDGVALFDFDTDGLNYYIDELGATMYYKTDGSMPMPDPDYIQDKFNYSDEIDPDEYYEEYEENTGRILGYYENGVFVADPYDTPVTYPVSQAVTRTHIEVTTIASEEMISEEAASHEVTVPNETVTALSPVTTAPRKISFSEKELEQLNARGNSYYYYDEITGRLIPLENERFTKTQGSERELTIAIQPDIDGMDDFAEELALRDERNNESVRKLMDNAPLAAIAVILALYVLIAGGYDPKEKHFALSSDDHIFAEFPAAAIAAAFAAVLAMLNCAEDITAFCEEIYTLDMAYMVYAVSFAALYAVVLYSTDTLLIRLKCKSLCKTSLTGRLIGKLIKLVKRAYNKVFESTIERDMMKHDKFTRRFLIRTIAFILLFLFPLIGGLSTYDCGIVIVCGAVLLAAYIFLSLRDFRDITRLCRHISDVNGGNYEKKIVSKESAIYVPTEKLNSISDGIQSAVDRQVRSERMKIDLVTNVSHDLKTPLTSIISYIDLLSSEEMSPAAKDYVKILDEKSQRLKAMVSDVFDLAKATSRTDINVEELDAVILTEQVLGDLSDKIEASGREIRKDIQADSAPIMAEGKRLYRVFQNVIDNALKYSMDGTRIYITLKNENGSCRITVKNIAAYEMNFTPDDIMERFTRGDESRTTEGNGLGLSIAKSFTEACGGNFTVTIDGDVFAAIIELPIINA